MRIIELAEQPRLFYIQRGCFFRIFLSRLHEKEQLKNSTQQNAFEISECLCEEQCVALMRILFSTFLSACTKKSSILRSFCRIDTFCPVPCRPYRRKIAVCLVSLFPMPCHERLGCYLWGWMGIIAVGFTTRVMPCTLHMGYDGRLTPVGCDTSRLRALALCPA